MADEVWSTRAGDIVYDTMAPDGTAVFTMPAVVFNPGAAKGAVARLYVPYLDAAPDSRYQHTAYWLIEGSANCNVSMTGFDGVTSSDWGLANLYFDEAGFPSGFTMAFGVCEYEMFDFVRAEPVLGE
jgi:hypothetical protein